MHVSELKIKIIVPAKDFEVIRNFQLLIAELNSKVLPPGVIEKVQQMIEILNTWEGPTRIYLKEVKQTKKRILKILHKDLGIVHQNFYSELWLSLGMACFGLPFGILIFAVTKNAAFLGVGLPFGMVLGLCIGAYLNRKAKNQNKVLPITQ